MVKMMALERLVEELYNDLDAAWAKLQERQQFKVVVPILGRPEPVEYALLALASMWGSEMMAIVIGRYDIIDTGGNFQLAISAEL